MNILLLGKKKTCCAGLLRRVKPEFWDMIGESTIEWKVERERERIKERESVIRTAQIRYLMPAKKKSAENFTPSKQLVLFLSHTVPLSRFLSRSVRMYMSAWSVIKGNKNL